MAANSCFMRLLFDFYKTLAAVGKKKINYTIIESIIVKLIQSVEKRW